MIGTGAAARGRVREEPASLFCAYCVSPRAKTNGRAFLTGGAGALSSRLGRRLIVVVEGARLVIFVQAALAQVVHDVIQHALAVRGEHVEPGGLVDQSVDRLALNVSDHVAIFGRPAGQTRGNVM